MFGKNAVVNKLPASPPVLNVKFPFWVTEFHKWKKCQVIKKRKSAACNMSRFAETSFRIKRESRQTSIHSWISSIVCTLEFTALRFANSIALHLFTHVFLLFSVYCCVWVDLCAFNCPSEMNKVIWIELNKLVRLSSTHSDKWRCHLQTFLLPRPVLEHKARHLFQQPISS